MATGNENTWKEDGKTMKKRVLIIFISIVLLAVSLSAYAENSIVGLWVTNSDPLILLLKLNKDNTCDWIWVYTEGTVTASVINGTWKLNGSKLLVKTEKGTAVMKGIDIPLKAQEKEYRYEKERLYDVKAGEYLTKVLYNVTK